MKSTTQKESNSLRVLIANPAVRRELDRGLERYFMGSGVRFPWSMVKQEKYKPRFSIFPMFLGYTAALLEQAGFDTKVIDGVPLNLSDQEFRERADFLQPDIIILEPNSAVISDALSHAEYFKRSCDATIIIAGSHVTAETQSVFRSCQAVDYAVLGEFEFGIRNLVTALQENKAAEVIETLEGVVTRSTVFNANKGSSDSACQKRKLAPMVEDLDSLPTPARHLFPAYFNNDMRLYHDGFNQLQPAMDMHATRGCPHSCNFCVWVHVLFDNGKQRLRSLDSIINEMESLVRDFGAEEIYFDDDNFTANKKFVSNFCNRLIERNVKIPWSALADAIALTEGMLEKMAEAGCIGIKFGLDSADSDVLRNSNKPLKVSRVTSLVEKARKLDIKTHMTVVLGLQGETKASLQRTFDFSCELDIDSIQFSLATPVPGTPLYNHLQATHKLSFVRWDELDGYSSSVILYDDISQEYLDRFEFDIHSRWLRARLRHPRWVLRQFSQLLRLGRSQGVRGLVRRIRRGVQLISGDSIMVGTTKGLTSIRW